MLRKAVALALSLSLALAASSALALKNLYFSHPELGELMWFRYKHAMPEFSIYGYIYFEIMDPTEPYRGLYAKGPSAPADERPTVAEVLAQILPDIREEEGIPGVLAYRGAPAAFAERLGALSAEYRVRAVSILGGFEGLEGFQELAGLGDFSEEEIRGLSDGYSEFTALVNGSALPYRVLSFQSWDEEESFVERYSFLKLEGDWRLSYISREYTDDYLERTSYIHGVPGSDPGVMEAVDDEALAGIEWGVSREEVLRQSGGAADGDAITVQDYILYRLPSTLEYVFEDGGLALRRFTFEEGASFYSAFVSLYTRYSDPITLSEEGEATWTTSTLQIVLRPGDEYPTVEFRPV